MAQKNTIVIQWKTSNKMSKFEEIFISKKWLKPWIIQMVYTEFDSQFVAILIHIGIWLDLLNSLFSFGEWDHEQVLPILIYTVQSSMCLSKTWTLAFHYISTVLFHIFLVFLFSSFLKSFLQGPCWVGFSYSWCYPSLRHVLFTAFLYTITILFYPCSLSCFSIRDLFWPVYL